ncbi:hypothetical protein BGX34_006375 [Mortierella sp. NVP85]|nr:hypothetical protein BGX34_006375 [Mortierella sp. NVP85]
MSAAKEGSIQESGTTTLSHGSIGSSSSLEKPEEPVDESTLKWRQTVEGNRSPNALRRWYLKNGSDGTYCGSDSPTQPVTININDRFEAELPLEGVEDGYYRVVLCVTPRCKDLSSVNTVIIEGIAKRKDGLYTQKPNDDSTVTVVPREEIYGFRKCFDNSGGYSYDHVVYGDECPTQVIRVGIDNTPYTRPVRIAALAFSDAGEFITTFYLTEGLGHIDIWDVRSQSGKSTSSSPQVITVPCAQAKFEVSKADPSWSPEINLDISTYGSQVALCTEEEAKGGISFRVFKWNPASPVDHDLSQPWPLQRTTTICDNGYYNMFSYHTSDPVNSKEEDERFCICDGLSFTVYNTVGRWAQIYRISMQQHLSFLAADQALDSLQGRYFAWLNTNGVISVWDFETGKLVSHILTGDDSATNPELSLDGSMLAVTVSGTIQFYDTFTGIKLGVYREGLSEESDIDYVLGQDHFLTFNLQESTVSKPAKHNVRSVVNVRNMSIVKNYDIHEDYYSQYLNAGKTMLFAYTEGSNVTVRNMGDILSAAASDECGVDGACPKKPVIPIVLYSGCDHRLENVEGTKFIVECRVPLISGDFTREIDITVDDGAADGEQRTLSIPLGVDLEDFYAFFIPTTSQLVYLAENNLMIWTLYAEDPICELTTIWKIQEDPPGTLPSDHVTRGIVSAQVCEHGRSFSIELTRPKWYRATVTYREMPIQGKPDTLTMPISASDTLSTSEEYRTIQGVLHLINVYRDGTVDCKQAIVRYLQQRIRPSPKHPASSLATICKAWTLENRGVIENLVDELLPENRVTWIPDSNLTKEQDPLVIILKHATDNPIAIKVAKTIMSYCVNRANKSMSLAFLAPLFGSLYNIMDLFPDEAARQLSRIAYIPVKNRSYILDNHILVHQPQFRLQFWKPNNQPLCKTKYPIMQLHVSDEIPDVSIKSFTRPVFSTSFDALWYYRDAKALGSSGEVKAEASDTTTTTWWRTLFRMIRLKTQLRAHSYVECYDFNLEFFDNPAITALVTYKW